MRLWTIQPVEVYDELKREKILHVDPKKSDFLNNSEIEKSHGALWTFKDAYDWIVSMMVKHEINGRENTFYPWWAWHTYKGKNKKPDLRTIGLGNNGERSVCIELDIPDDEILLTSHTYWHDVLNDRETWLIDVDESSYNDFETIWKIHHDVLEYLSPSEYERYKKESWEKIINFAYLDDYIQATFWNLRLENVVRVKEFTCK